MGIDSAVRDTTPPLLATGIILIDLRLHLVDDRHPIRPPSLAFKGGAVLFYKKFLGILNELFCGAPQDCAPYHPTY